MFRLADIDDSGSLDRKEFAAAMSRLGLGLTGKQITTLMDDLDDGDGKLDYGELFAFFAGDFDETVLNKEEDQPDKSTVLKSIKKDYWSGMLNKKPSQIKSAMAKAKELDLSAQVDIGRKLLQQLHSST